MRLQEVKVTYDENGKYKVEVYLFFTKEEWRYVYEVFDDEDCISTDSGLFVMWFTGTPKKCDKWLKRLYKKVQKSEKLIKERELVEKLLRCRCYSIFSGVSEWDLIKDKLSLILEIFNQLTQRIFTHLRKIFPEEKQSF